MDMLNHLVLCLVTLTYFTVANSSISYLGKNFVFAILPAFRQKLSENTTIYLEIGSKDAGSLVLDVPALNIFGKQYTLQKNGYTKIELKHSIQYFVTTQGARGVSIRSTTDISVLVTYVLSNYFGMASYRVYPVSVLGNYYIAASYPPVHGFKVDFYSHIMVVAVKNNTHVSIIGHHFEIDTTLNAMDVYQYQSPLGKHLTGTVVVANKEVAVLSGSGFSRPYDQNLGAPMLSQMIPRRHWAQRFIAVDEQSVSSMTLRLLSSQHSLSATLLNTESTLNLTEQGAAITVHSYPTMVASEHSMEVVQNNGEYMTLVPGVSQYMNEYSFLLPVIDSKHIVHILIVVVPSDNKEGILLDGLPFSGPAHNLSTPYGQFTTMETTTREGYHHMVHTNPQVTFGLLAFGRDPYFDILGIGSPYGFYVGMSFNDPDPRELRGPLCFDCQQISTPSMCRTMISCDTNQENDRKQCRS